MFKLDMTLKSVKLMLFLLFTFSSTLSLAVKEVKVGAYNFPPYFSKNAQDKNSLSLVDLIVSLLNSQQKEFLFVIVPIAPEDRVSLFNAKKFDVIFFEDLNWGWSTSSNHFFPLPINDGEVFISRKKIVDHKDALKKASKLAGVKGYHYKLGGSKELAFTAGEGRLLTDSPESVLSLVVDSRVDLGIVSRSFFEMKKAGKPDLYNSIYSASKFDTSYNLGVVLQKNSPVISKKDFNKMLDYLTNNGVFIYQLQRLRIKG